MPGMTLKRPVRPRALISLVPMIDVMLILLVFFMVTSTYLDLDMIPAVRQEDRSLSQATDAPGKGDTLLIRLGADGVPVLRGAAVPGEALAQALRAALTDDPLAQVLILPSGGATTQALVSVMEAATRAGAARLRVVRLEARP